MQKCTFTLRALLLALVVTAFGVVAQTSAQERQTQDQSASTLQGKVSSVDSNRGQLSIRDDQGNEKALQVSSTARISKAGRDIKLNEVKAGDQVQLVVEGSADNPTVKTIVVMPSKSGTP